MRVAWTETATSHLDHIFDYIAVSSEGYARRVVDRLTRRSAQIADFPESGRRVPELDLPQIREVLEGPYRMIYHIRADGIDVIAVIHGAQIAPWVQLVGDVAADPSSALELGDDENDE